MKDLMHLLWFILMGPVHLLMIALKTGLPYLGAAANVTRKALVARVNSINTNPAPHAVASAPVGKASERVMFAEKLMTVVQAGDFEVADRIISIRLVPPVGVLNLRVYKETNVIKRDLIVHEPRLRAIMKGRRFTFPDVTFDPKSDLEDIKDETVSMAEELINKVGNARVKAHKPTKDEQKAQFAAPASAPKAQVKAVQPSKAQVTPVVAVQAKADASPHTQKTEKLPTKGRESRVFAPQATVGITYVGKLKQAGAHRVTPRDRDPYEVFQATLLLDNGAELPLRGAELERELEAAGCQIGERVAITPMGKVPVTLTSGGEGSKNLYKVDNLTVAQ